MSQITFYLDAETEAKMKAAVKASGLSQSKWIANVIREKIASEWPAHIRALAGAWSDLPLAEEIRGSGEDALREPFRCTPLPLALRPVTIISECRPRPLWFRMDPQHAC